MSGHKRDRINDAKRVTLAALACILPQALIACNQQPPPPPMTQGETNSTKIDPFDGPGAPHKSAAATKAEPAAQAKPAVSESELGIPFYPGATPFLEPGNALASSMTMPGTTMILLQTGDPVAKVVAFYQDKLTGPDENGKPGPPLRHEGTRDGKPTVTLSRTDGHTLLAVIVRQSDNITIMELARMEVPASSKANLPGIIPGAASTAPVGAPDGAGNAPAPAAASPFSGISRTPGTPSPATQPPKRSLQYP